MKSPELVSKILAARNAPVSALDQVLPELHAIRPANGRTLNAEASKTVSRVPAAAPAVLAMRDQIEKQTPLVPIASLEKLELYAHGMQELWDIFLAYNVVLLEMDRVAREQRIWPTNLSFVASLRLIRNEWLWTAAASRPGSIPRHLQALRESVSRLVQPSRGRERTYPRAVKIKMSDYSRKRPEEAAR